MKKVDVWPLLSEESRAAALKSEALYAAMTGLPEHPVAAARAGYNAERRHWNSFVCAVAQVENMTFASAEGEVKLRLYHPAPVARRPVAIYLHGGGYILGNLDTHDRIMRLLAHESGWAVLGVDYALAPERKFPTQILQIAAVAENLGTILAPYAVDTGRFAFAGDSAGAALSLGTTLELRRGPARPEALVLYYGGFGLKDSPSRRLYGNKWDGLLERDLATYQSAYRRTPEDGEDPRLDPLRADLAGLPRSFIGAVALDPLRDDSIALAEALALDGVPHEIKVYEQVLHSFLHFSAIEPRALTAIRDGARFLAAP